MPRGLGEHSRFRARAPARRPRTRREFESRACKGIDHANSEAPLPVVNVDGYPSGSGCTAGGRLGRVRGGAHQSGQHQVGRPPPSLPKGAKVAVLYGDPSKAGPFCMRLMAPAGYKIPPHWHSQAEALTVISGTFYLGMGDKMDATAAQPLKAGLSLSTAQGTSLRVFQGGVGGPVKWRRSVRHHLYQRRRRSAEGNQALKSKRAPQGGATARIIEKPRFGEVFFSSAGERYKAATDDVPYMCRSRLPSASR